MRIALGLLTLTLLIFGGHALASGDDVEPGKSAGEPARKAAGTMKQLKLRLEALEMETAYLRSREAALTAYVLLNEQRGRSLDAVTTKAREQGFEKSKTPTPSRITLLTGLEGFAASLSVRLPALTKEEAALLKKLTAFRRLK